MPNYRDGRDKPGHDQMGTATSLPLLSDKTRKVEKKVTNSEERAPELVEGCARLEGPAPAKAGMATGTAEQAAIFETRRKNAALLRMRALFFSHAPSRAMIARAMMAKRGHASLCPPYSLGPT